MLTKAVKLQKIKDAFKSYKDFPKPGITFRDIFPVLRDPVLYDDLLNIMAEEIKVKCPKPDAILGLESRGFLFAPSLALKMKTAFVPVRKAGKLPGETFSYAYELEYGKDTIEIGKDSLKQGANVVIVDDLLATGGTLKACLELMKQAKVNVCCCCVVVSLLEFKSKHHFNVPHISLFEF